MTRAYRSLTALLGTVAALTAVITLGVRGLAVADERYQRVTDALRQEARQDLIHDRMENARQVEYWGLREEMAELEADAYYEMLDRGEPLSTKEARDLRRLEEDIEKYRETKQHFLNLIKRTARETPQND